MEGYNDEELRIELQKEIGHKKGRIEEKDIDKIYKMVMAINKRTPIFKDLPEPLTNLAYNIFYKQIYSRNIKRDYKEDTAISAINNSITQTSAIIDMIKEEAKKLGNESKKQAFYKLMRDNHMIMAQLYMNRKNFYDSSINILCQKAGRSELDKEITSKDAMVKLLELTKSKKCSRLQRVLDILIKHGDNLTITNTNGEEQSNADKLGLTNDDIYSLQLLARTEESDFFEFTYNIINNLVYKSIYDKDNDKKLHNSILELYYAIYKMSIMSTISTMNNEFSSYKEKKKNIIKTCLNQLNNMESIDFMYNKSILTLLDDYKGILEHNDFDVVKVRNNVVPNYFKVIEHNVYGIIGRPIEETTNKGMRTKTIIIVAIIMVVMLVVLSIVFLYPNEANKIMNNLNIM
ncbi:hypothetical protein NEPAR04_1774 [Nematocida parisii]|nr:hypothetical protein NEPAR08_1865 [Nematocida parisii]KAI5131195.1 hypothetical protein NEPAR03_2330 [Nematocida parisii]KAI5143109.1 hypothetical protein NEPAR04_1774 [Nematocida parisii]